MNLDFFSIDWHQKPNKRERMLFFASFVTGLFLLIRSCVVPAHQAVHKLQDQVELLTQKNETAQSEALSPEFLPQDATQPKGKVGETLQRLSDPSLLQGIKLQSSLFEEPTKEAEFVRQNITLVLAGSFYSIGKYIQALENMPAPMVIETFSMYLDDVKLSRVTAEAKGFVYGRH